MKKLIIVILILSTGITYGQWPNLDLYSRAGQVQIRNNITYAVNRGCDSLGKVFDAKLKLLEVAFDKKLKDSMAALAVPDGKTIVVNGGKASAVGSTTDLKPVYDTISRNKAEQAVINAALANNINIVSGRVTTVENKVTALESWRTEITAQLVVINSKLATIPKTALSTSTSTTTTITTTELKP